MNERIKELLNEATSGHEQETDRSKVMTVSDKELEIFANLIVFECGEFCGQVDRDAMFKHFGVEE
jgi:hypothetical protein